LNQLIYLKIATAFFAGTLFFHLQKGNIKKNEILKSDKISENIEVPLP
jgi:hypothetical protein